MKYERKTLIVWREPLSWFEYPMRFVTRVDQNNEVVLIKGFYTFTLQEVQDMLDFLKKENSLIKSQEVKQNGK